MPGFYKVGDYDIAGFCVWFCGSVQYSRQRLKTGRSILAFRPLIFSSKTAVIIPHVLKLSDDFTGKELGLQWTFWKEYAPKAVTLEDRTLRLKAKGKTPEDGRLLLTTAEDKNYPYILYRSTYELLYITDRS